MSEKNNELQEFMVENERLDQFEANDSYRDFTSQGIPSDSNENDKDAAYWLNVLYNE